MPPSLQLGAPQLQRQVAPVPLLRGGSANASPARRRPQPLHLCPHATAGAAHSRCERRLRKRRHTHTPTNRGQNGNRRKKVRTKPKTTKKNTRLDTSVQTPAQLQQKTRQQENTRPKTEKLANKYSHSTPNSRQKHNFGNAKTQTFKNEPNIQKLFQPTQMHRHTHKQTNPQNTQPHEPTHTHTQPQTGDKMVIDGRK